MKLRRIFAVLAACAIAATSVISASAAEITNHNKKVYDDAAGKDTDEDDVTGYGVQKVSLDDMKKMSSIKLTITFADGWEKTGAGPAVVVQTDKIKWGLKNCNTDGKGVAAANIDKGVSLEIKGKVAVYTVDFTDLQADIAASTVWGSVQVKYNNWGADFTVNKVELLDKDGKVIVTDDAVAVNEADYNYGQAAGGDTGSSSTASTIGSSSTANNSTSNPKTGATAGLALAGLAIAGAAVVAAKKSK